MLKHREDEKAGRDAALCKADGTAGVSANSILPSLMPVNKQGTANYSTYGKFTV